MNTDYQKTLNLFARLEGNIEEYIRTAEVEDLQFKNHTKDLLREVEQYFIRRKQNVLNMFRSEEMLEKFRG